MKAVFLVRLRVDRANAKVALLAGPARVRYQSAVIVQRLDAAIANIVTRERGQAEEWHVS